MVKWLLCTLLLALVGLKGGERVPRETFTIYYGTADQRVIRHLNHRRLAIIEPDGWRQAQVQELEQGGTQAFGYVNVMEQEQAYQLSEQEALLVNGSRVAISKWDTYMLDLRRPKVQAALTQKVSRIAAAGYTGVFLDTVGDIDDYLAESPRVQLQQRRALAAWLSRMQAQYPKLKWWQNRGFKTYTTATDQVVSMILWEDFNAEKITGDTWSQRWLAELQRHPARLLAVCPDAASQRAAESVGMTTTVNENDVYDHL